MAKKKPGFDLPDPEIIAEGVTPDAALEFWKWRAKLTDEEAKALNEEVRYRAFYVTGLAKHDLVQLVSDAIEEAVKNGETLADFKKRIVEAIQAQGWHDYRVENIFRTNLQTAYSAGRYKKMQAVKESRPYWQYIAVMDRRVRPSHAILHGKVYPADHEFWATNYPPNGFRCRCGVRTLSERQVKAQGLTVEKEMPKAGVWTDPKTGMEYFVHFPGADKGFRHNPGKDWADAGLDLKKHGMDTAPPVPKKEPLTQKKLEADISAVETLIKATTDKQAIVELEAKKAELQTALQKKKVSAEKKKLSAQAKKVEAQITAFPVKTYSGIWMDAVTTADWSAKAGAIPHKKAYFQGKLKAGDLTPEEAAKFEGYLSDLAEFDATGKTLADLLEKQKNIQDSLSLLKNGGKDTLNPYSQARKDAALWAQAPQEADAVMRTRTGDVWSTANKAEKDALYAYTQSSGGFNRPLRGHEGRWGNFKGVGKVDLDAEGRGEAIRHMTEVISRSTYDRDIWLQRGIETAAGAAAFLELPEEAFRKWSLAELKEALEGKEKVEHAFCSCGSAKGQGFGGFIFRIYCPRGTKMMYSEPFSHYGYGDKREWDGKRTQEYFSYEDETIIQRGTKFKVTKVEKTADGALTFELEVVEQI